MRVKCGTWWVSVSYRRRGLVNAFLMTGADQAVYGRGLVVEWGSGFDHIWVFPARLRRKFRAQATRG